MLGVLSASALGQERREPPPEFREMAERSRAFSERMRHARDPEEMRKIMDEQMALQRARAVENLKEQLGVSEAEWTVVRPRLEAVYERVHAQPVRGNVEPTTPVEQRRKELRELLRDENAEAEQIKARLSALRAEKEKARQELAKARRELQQIMTLRQEAVLVLAGLLE
jgi:chromosome segregation ATPase